MDRLMIASSEDQRRQHSTMHSVLQAATGRTLVDAA
jgi:hypothetical protein